MQLNINIRKADKSHNCMQSWRVKINHLNTRVLEGRGITHYLTANIIS